MKRMIGVAIVLFVGIPASSLLAQETITRSVKLTESSYADIRSGILVCPPEERWEAIPWRPSLAVAIEEARQMDKPILLWMMNGHPCGMT